jgi:hypothetical protein
LPAINGWEIDKTRIKDGKKVSEGFSYSSDSNDEWMSLNDLSEWIKSNSSRIGKI